MDDIEHNSSLVSDWSRNTPKRGRSESPSDTEFSCSECSEKLKADGKVYFLPFCRCLYCGECVIKFFLRELGTLHNTLGSAADDLPLVTGAADDLALAIANQEIKIPASILNLFTCKSGRHLRIPGAVECYGTACSICTLDGRSNNSRMYLPCGHPFCKPHITKWLSEKGKRVCPTCRSDVPKEEPPHFKKNGTYVLLWPRSF